MEIEIPKAETSSIPSIENIQFIDLFELEKIQQLQDLFADTHGVASIITQPDGTPITKPSNFTKLCTQIIRKTEKGLANCFESDSIIGQPNSDGPFVQPCLSCGLWDAGASITVNDKHIANWLIGQIRNEDLDRDRLIEYSTEIGANKKEFLAALDEVPVLSTEQFKKIAKLLFVFAKELSDKAFSNFKLKQEVERRTEALKMLEEKEKIYHLIAENTADVITLLDLNLNYKFLSPSVFNLLGYHAEELVNLGFNDITTPESWMVAMQMLGEEMELEKSGAADPNRSRTIVTEQIKKDGKKIWVEATVSFIRDKDGHPINILAVSKDITERKQAEEKLLESFEKHNSILKSAMDGFWIIETNGRFLEVNNAYCQMTGFSEEEMLQMSISEFDVERTVEDIGAQMAVLMKDGYGRIEGKHRTKDGAPFDYELSIKYQPSNGGRFVGFIRDITKRKNVEIELTRAREKAEECDKLKSAFLANMSHEIRTPLNSIIGFSELLNDPHFDEAQKYEFTRTIIEQGNILLLIINDIMDLSMLEAQKIVIKKAYFDVSKLITDLHNDYKKIAQTKGIDIKCEISKDIFNLKLKSDIFRIKQILINLISNAIKFTEKGIIEIGCFQQENSVTIFVKDTGIGISKIHFDSIFERFRQIDNSTTRKYGGNGLGLAISKSIAEILGGTISVESAINQGSTFYLTLPK